MMTCLHILFLSVSILLQQQEAPSLDSVLKKMDAAAASFQATQAETVSRRICGEGCISRGYRYTSTDARRARRQEAEGKV